MFKRKINEQLKSWAESPDRKPLILRGARQVGKTTAVEMFAKEYANFICLNLENQKEAALFSKNLPVTDIYQAILLQKNITPGPGKVLLFIDEIQFSPDAVRLLRYFYEVLPEIHVIAAGSLLEVMAEQKNIDFPVGRVQFFFMYPLTFEEFLLACGETQALQALQAIPLPEFSRQRLMELFHVYAQIGGMPEIVARYAEKRDLSSLKPYYQSLLTAFQDDAEKYARNNTIKHILRHCIESAPLASGERISFAGFGKSNYRSREVGEALRTLERAMLVYLLYPTTAWEIPLLPDLKKSPRLLFFDIGLLNFSAGLQGHFFEYPDLHSFYRGKLAEQIVAQELLAGEATTFKKPVFWVREKKQSNAEIDFLYTYDRHVIPIEVKAGASGSLRSLHQFMSLNRSPYAVRLYSDRLEITTVATQEGKQFFLLNLPYFLTGKLRQYVEWFLKEKPEALRSIYSGTARD
jgi:predicted AAA+ superfamily ATPase